MLKTFISAVFLIVLAGQAIAAGPKVPLDEADVDIHDKAAAQRGLQLFANYCMGCHGMEYARYERVADDLGIPHEVFLDNIIFGDAKIGELMSIAMEPKAAAGWFGAPPPDLTLEARLRGPDWLYSYLRAFYKDESRPWGVNNSVFKDVGMPHVLADLQGLCAEPPVFGEAAEVDPISGAVVGGSGCQNFAKEGSMSPEEFDKAMLDLVTFLEYVGEPSRLEAERIAPFVLLFLVILFIPVYLLNREYWKDVH